MEAGTKVIFNTFSKDFPPQLEGVVMEAETHKKLGLALIEVINPPNGYPHVVSRKLENIKSI